MSGAGQYTAAGWHFTEGRTYFTVLQLFEYEISSQTSGNVALCYHPVSRVKTETDIKIPAAFTDWRLVNMKVQTAEIVL